jgi:exodeoxyribonuclease VII large subunit
LSELQHIKLSELIQKVEDTLRNTFGNEQYWIVAEISGHKFYANNDRHYFEFIEKSATSNDPVTKIRGVSWVSGSQRIKVFEKETGQLFTNGIQVLVKVKIEFHKVYGMQLVMLDIDPSFTLGNLELQRRETLQKLITNHADIVTKIGDEYVTRNKKITLHRVIQKIALIGSPNSEGYIDFTHTIASNLFQYKFEIDIYQSTVQGGDAEVELIERLFAIHKNEKQYDCVVIIRGGGAKSDFLVFDKFRLSLAVAKFSVPVITGIGHHNDVSIVDMMAHTNTKTPTKAAEFIISHNRQFEEDILALQKSAVIKSQQLLSKHIQAINATNTIIINQSRLYIGLHKDALTGIQQIVTNKTKGLLYHLQTDLVNLLNQILSQPKITTANRQNELNNQINNIKIFSHKYLVNQKGYVGHFVSLINMMRPENILKKGFAIISTKGSIISNSDDIQTGDDITITMEKHIISTTVNYKKDNDGTNL